MKPELLYFLAGPESAAIVRAHMDAVRAYNKRRKELLERCGLAGCEVMVTQGYRLRYVVSPDIVPPGWRRVPKSYRLPDYIEIDWKSDEGKAHSAALGGFPNWENVQKALGCKETWGTVHGDVHAALRSSSYGAESVGDAIVITADQDKDGTPFGGAPTGCAPLARSAYWAMREAADAARGGK